MTEATNITKLVKYINDTFADKEMHNPYHGGALQMVGTCRLSAVAGRWGSIKFRQKRVLSWLLLPKSV